MEIMWKQTDITGRTPRRGRNIIAVGNIPMAPFIILVRVDDQGSTLILDAGMMQPEDAGYYICEIGHGRPWIGTNPPSTLRHQVSLIGNI